MSGIIIRDTIHLNERDLKVYQNVRNGVSTFLSRSLQRGNLGQVHDWYDIGTGSR